METKFYLCTKCGNIIMKIADSGVTPVCCGEPMKLLEPKMTDGAFEKHMPVVTRIDDCKLRINVGSVPHPMVDEHYIMFIYVETIDNEGHPGGKLIKLKPQDNPECVICSCDQKIVAVYEYCNLHGLWKLEL